MPPLPPLAATPADYYRPYHTGEVNRPDYDPNTNRRKPPEHIDREVIAWDMEGISHDGQERPQAAVLFGCSADVVGALSAKRLSTPDMLEYIIRIGELYPHAIHVGYGFKYDANMLIYGLPVRHIIKLWKSGTVSFRLDDTYVWSIRWIPGKMFTVTRKWGKGRKTRARTTVTIYDYSSFFGTGFLEAAERILGDGLTADDRDVIDRGKRARGSQSWDDMSDIRHYWEREIVLIQRTFERFRDVMYRAGFALKEWYGPGALANYINATNRIYSHLAAAQTSSGVMPREVHLASKVAFSGGHFELFQAGRITGPVYAADIGSAYPYALTKVPSLNADEGEWVHVSDPRRIGRFGVYRISFRAPAAQPIEYRPMPLFWRDPRGLISYPQITHGWYWSPEAAMALKMPGAQILEGWEWQSNEREFPWLFLQEMYNTRMRLGKQNLLSMPFKLGPNSLYGKYAQTVGWDQKKRLPPKSHALPVAGWVTSYCRAMLYTAMSQNVSSVIAVETDAIYSTEPLTLNEGSGLGEWAVEQYDEILYIQNGFYHYKQDGKWKGVRSRGISRSEYPVEMAQQYLRSLKGGQLWEPMTLTTRPRFIGAGAAIAAGAPVKQIMTSWRPQTKLMTLGDTGKRVHVPNACTACAAGASPYDEPHRLAIHTRSDGELLSFPRRLPWEQDHTAEVIEIRDRIALEGELISR